MKVVSLGFLIALLYITSACNQNSSNDSTEADSSETSMHEHEDHDHEHEEEENVMPEHDGDKAEKEGDGIHYGMEIDEEGAMELNELKDQMANNDMMEVKVKATVSEVCKARGCWMTLEDTDEMRVQFKDYGFFVPVSMEGKEVVMQGKAYYDTVSVETLRHFAQDAGKSEEEIEAIQEPKIKLNFEAEGVKLLAAE